MPSAKHPKTTYGIVGPGFPADEEDLEAASALEARVKAATYAKRKGWKTYSISFYRRSDGQRGFINPKTGSASPR